MSYRIDNIFNTWPKIDEGQLLVSRFNIYSGIYLKTSDIDICTDLSKLPKPIAENINPDYLILSHLSLDHFDKKQILSSVSSKTKIFTSPQCFERLYQQLKSKNLEKNLFLAVRDYVYTDDNINISFFESIHGDYLEPLTFKIMLLKYGISIYHGIDSLKLLSYEKVKLGNQIDIGIFPMSIAPTVSQKTFDELVTETGVNLAITNHVLSEKIKTYHDKNNKKVILLDWNERCIININKRALNLKFPESQIEKTISQIHIENDVAIMDVLKWINSDNFTIKYKALLASSLIAITKPNIFKKLFLNRIIMEIDKFLKSQSKGYNVKRLAFAAAIWAIGNYYSNTSNEKFNRIDVYYKIIERNNQYLNYWLCESASQIGLGNQYNYNLIKEVFEKYKKGKAWKEVLNRRVFAWSNYHLLEYVSNKIILDLKSYFGLFYEFLNDENPDVRLIGIMGLELLIKKQNCDKFINKILNVAMDMLGDEEFELVECSLNLLQTIIKKYPSKKKQIKAVVEKNAFVSKNENWHVRYKYLKIIEN